MSNVERARVLRKKETWAEKLMWHWLRDRRFSATNSAANIRRESTFLISFAKKRASPSSSTVRATAIPTGKITMPNVINTWLHKESRSCGFGILICAGTPKASATRFLRNCSGAHRMRCRITRDRHWGKLVEHPPSTRPSPPGEGEPFAAPFLEATIFSCVCGRSTSYL